jgi:hypothetical protein
MFSGASVCCMLGRRNKNTVSSCWICYRGRKELIWCTNVRADRLVCVCAELCSEEHTNLLSIKKNCLDNP